MNLRSFLSAAIFRATLLLMLAGFAARATELENHVSNGDFSQTSNGQPSDWAIAGDETFVTQTLRVITEDAGKRCARLNCSRFERQGPAAHVMLAQVGKVKLVKGRTYEFTCQFRAEGIAGQSVSVAISDTQVWENCGLQTAFHLTGAWTSCRHVFKATRDAGPTSRLQIWYAETGALYVAEVRIVEHPVEEAEFTDVIEPSRSRNLVPNASFELAGSGWSSLGAATGWGNLDRLHGGIESRGGPRGQSFLRIPLGGDRTPVLYFDYYEPVTRREIHPLAANKGWMKVAKGEAYTLSCFMRASRQGAPAVLGATARDPAGSENEYRQAIRLTTKWQQYSLTFNPQERYVFVFAGPDLQREERVDVDVDAIQLERGDKATEFVPHRPVEMALEPAEAAGIFYDDQPCSLLLRVCNDGNTPSRLNVRFRATDFEDRQVPLPDCAIEAPARSTVQRAVRLPADWKGFYTVSAAAQAEGANLAATVRLAIVPRNTDEDSVCGINHAFVTADLIKLASKAGVSWYRDWSLKWQHIEPAKGEYHWELADAQIERVLREGKSVLPILPPFPSADWSSEAPLSIPVNGSAGPRARQAWGPKDPRELDDFIERATARYKDRVHIWEFLNEPVYTDYALPGKSYGRRDVKTYTPADYVSLLATAAAAMRKADPACKVIGGIAGEPGGMTQDVLAAGILKHVDYFNLHIYPGLRAPEAYAVEMDALARNMDAQGGRKPIWITEFSYYGVDNLPRQPFVAQSDDWGAERLLESERQCADYTARFFAIMLSHGAQKIFIHCGASGAVNTPNFECALFDYGGAPRKLFAELAVLTRALGPAPRCAGTKAIGKAGHAAGFETGKRAVLVLWQSEEAPAPDLAMPSRRDVTWMDAMGRRSAAPPSRLSSSLAYMLGPAGKAAELLDRMAQ